MKKVFVILGLLTASCSEQPNKGADGYEFGQKQYVNEKVYATVVTYASKKSFQEAARQYNAPADTVAFTVLKRGDHSLCRIHMLDPAVEYKPELVGHEFLHCVYGQWHTDNNSFQ